MIRGDEIKVTKADGAEKAGTAFWGCFPVDAGGKLDESGDHYRHAEGFLGPCDYIFTAEDLASYIEEEHPTNDDGEFEGFVTQQNRHNFVWMAEQLIAMGELEVNP